MTKIRDEIVRRLNLIVHINQDGLARNINLKACGFAVHNRVTKLKA